MFFFLLFPTQTKDNESSEISHLVHSNITFELVLLYTLFLNAHKHPNWSF